MNLVPPNNNPEVKIMREDYKILAEFLEFKYNPYTQDGNPNPNAGVKNAGWYRNPTKTLNSKLSGYICRKTLDLNFKYNWDNLMEVVNKIESLESTYHGGFNVTIQTDTCNISSRNKSKSKVYSCTYSSKGNKAQAVYESCLKFVKYINQNK